MNAYGCGIVLHNPKIKHAKNQLPIMTLAVEFEKNVKLGVSLYGDAAEAAMEQINKGDEVFFDGELREEVWTSKAGEQKETKMKVRYFKVIPKVNKPVTYMDGIKHG